MDQIKDILPEIFEKIHARNENLYARICKKWIDLPLKKMKDHTSVVGLENGVLVVHVDSSSWLFELNLQRQKIEELINREFPQISRITFKIGKVK